MLVPDQTVGRRVLARQHCDDPWERKCPSRLDGADASMRMRRAHHMRMDLARHVDVVAKAAGAGNEAARLP
jgi:hypothetical protein